MKIQRAISACAIISAGTFFTTIGLQPAFAVSGVDAQPEKVVIDQSYENIPVRLGGVGANESCTITLENYATRDYVDSDFLLDGAATTTLKAYDWQITPGKHQVLAECTDYDTFTDTTAYDDIVVKFRGYVTNKATRSGAYVTITGKATRYSASSLSARSPIPGKTLILEKKVGGIWKAVKYPKTSSTGAYSIRVYSSAAAYWRVRLPETTKAWSAAATPVLR